MQVALIASHSLGDVGIKEARHEATIEGEPLTLELVKKLPDALGVAMETVPHHDLVVCEGSGRGFTRLDGRKLLQGL